MTLFTIYSPKGEKFEVSKPNFDDLRRNDGWSPNPPETSTAAIAAATQEPATGTPAAIPLAPIETDALIETPPAADSEEDAAKAEKAALIAELKERFDFDADKRWNVAKLTAKRDELAEAAE